MFPRLLKLVSKLVPAKVTHGWNVYKAIAAFTALSLVVALVPLPKNLPSLFAYVPNGVVANDIVVDESGDSFNSADDCEVEDDTTPNYTGGDCTLREAIAQAAATSGENRIVFDESITNNILLGTTLTINDPDPLVIQGNVASNNLTVVLDGSSLDSGSVDSKCTNAGESGSTDPILDIRSSDVTIDSLSIINAPGNGMQVIDADRATIQNNWIGTTDQDDTTTPEGNGSYGICVFAETTDPETSDPDVSTTVISGNIIVASGYDGIRLEGLYDPENELVHRVFWTDITSNLIGNLTGSDVNNEALTYFPGNHGSGIGLKIADYTTIRRNVITNNGFGFGQDDPIPISDGITHMEANYNTIFENYIGTTQNFSAPIATVFPWTVGNNGLDEDGYLNIASIHPGQADNYISAPNACDGIAFRYYDHIGNVLLASGDPYGGNCPDNDLFLLDNPNNSADTYFDASALGPSVENFVYNNDIGSNLRNGIFVQSVACLGSTGGPEALIYFHNNLPNVLLDVNSTLFPTQSIHNTFLQNTIFRNDNEQPNELITGSGSYGIGIDLEDFATASLDLLFEPISYSSYWGPQNFVNPNGNCGSYNPVQPGQPGSSEVDYNITENDSYPFNSDAGYDPDAGANRLINFPLIDPASTPAVITGTGAEGTLVELFQVICTSGTSDPQDRVPTTDAAIRTDCDVDVWNDQNGSPADDIHLKGHGQGFRFLGNAYIPVDGDTDYEGTWSISPADFDDPGDNFYDVAPFKGGLITATATDFEAACWDNGIDPNCELLVASASADISAQSAGSTGTGGLWIPDNFDPDLLAECEFGIGYNNPIGDLPRCAGSTSEFSPAEFVGSDLYSLSKTDNVEGSTVNEGADIEYTITLTNTGSTVLTVGTGALSDVLPDSVIFDNCTWLNTNVLNTAGFCAPDSGPDPLIGLDFGTLDPGATLTIQIVVQVRTGLTDEACTFSNSIVGNNEYINGNGPATETGALNHTSGELTVDSETCNPPVGEDLYTLEKKSNPLSGSVNELDSILYTITLTNTGSTVLTVGSGALSDVLPTDSVDYQSCNWFKSSGSPMSGLCVPDSGPDPIVATDFGTLDPSATLTISITADVLSGLTGAFCTFSNSVYGNNEYINGENGQATETGALNHTSSELTVYSESCAQGGGAAYMLNKTDNIPDHNVDPGEEVIYTITLTNTGSDALAVGTGSLSDLLPTDSVNYANNCTWNKTNGSLPFNGSCALGSNPLIGTDFGTLAVGATLTITIKVNVKPGLSGSFCTFNNEVSPAISGEEMGTTPADHTSPMLTVNSVSCNQPTTYSFTMSKSESPPSVELDEIITYTIIVNNTGSGALTLGVGSLSDTLPAGTSLVSGTCTWSTTNPSNGNCNAPLGNDVLSTTNFGTLNAGQTLTVTYQVRAAITPASCEYINTVTATITDTNSNLLTDGDGDSNNSVIADLDPCIPSSSGSGSVTKLVKVGTGTFADAPLGTPANANRGDALTYLVHATNSSGTGTTLFVTDTFPASSMTGTPTYVCWINSSSTDADPALDIPFLCTYNTTSSAFDSAPSLAGVQGFALNDDQTVHILVSGYVVNDALGLSTPDFCNIADIHTPLLTSPVSLTDHACIHVLDPNLVIYKSVLTPNSTPAGESSGSPGAESPVNDAISYYIDVANTGSGALTGLALTDSFPTGLGGTPAWTCQFFVEAGTTETNHSAETYPASPTCTVNTSTGVITDVPTSINAGQVLRIRLSGKNIPNSVSANLCNVIRADATLFNNRTSQACIRVTGPTLQIAKTVSSTNPGPGETVTYTMTVTNNGSVPALGVRIVDDLDDATSGVDLIPSCVNSIADVVPQDFGTPAADNSISWPAIDLAPGASRAVRMLVTLRHDLVVSTSCRNVAVASGTNVPSDEDEADITIQAALDFEKEVTNDSGGGEDPDVFSIGDTVNYRLTIRNNSAANFSNLTTRDSIPEEEEDLRDVVATSGAINNSALDDDRLEVSSIVVPSHGTATIDYNVDVMNDSDFPLDNYDLDSSADQDESDFYPEDVEDDDVESSSHDDADDALDAPDGNYVSLGEDGEITLQTTDRRGTHGKLIVDGSGDDFCILELDQSGEDTDMTNEEYEVEVSQTDRDRDFISVGRASDDSNCFDLSDADEDITWARFVRIIDTSGRTSGRSPGADIDAVCLLNLGGFVTNTASLYSGSTLLGTQDRDILVDFTDAFDDPLKARDCREPRVPVEICDFSFSPMPDYCYPPVEEAPLPPIVPSYIPQIPYTPFIGLPTTGPESAAFPLVGSLILGMIGWIAKRKKF